MKKYIIFLLPLLLHAHATEALFIIIFIYFIAFIIGVFFLRFLYKSFKEWRENDYKFFK